METSSVTHLVRLRFLNGHFHRSSRTTETAMEIWFLLAAVIFFPPLSAIRCIV
jgi:hypothetical protein